VWLVGKADSESPRDTAGPPLAPGEWVLYLGHRVPGTRGEVFQYSGGKKVWGSRMMK
jgi:hypothetical protein